MTSLRRFVTPCVPVWGYEVYDVGEGNAQKETNTGRPNGRGPVAGFLLLSDRAFVARALLDPVDATD